jgi:SAM-dependent methyltransferase
MNVPPLRLPPWAVELLSGFPPESGVRRPAPDPRGRSARASVVADLSALFNRTPGLAGVRVPAYLRDARHRDAYAFYYGTVNSLKVLPPLAELQAAGVFAASAPLRVLEFGCGTGAGVLGIAVWMDAGEKDRTIHYTATDAVPEALDATRRTWSLLPEHLRSRITLETRRVDLAGAPDAAGADLVLAMNVLNELPERARAALPLLLEQCCARDGAALLIEPALRIASRALLYLRDEAVAAGWRVFAPCCMQAPCPALASEDDWCHHDHPWERPAFIADIDERIGNVKRSLKFSYLTLRRDDADLPRALGAAASSRVVSELFREKGRTRALLCGTDGRSMHLRNDRDATDANSDFGDLHRYDLVDVSQAEPRAHDVRVGPETRLRRVWP